MSTIPDRFNFASFRCRCAVEPIGRGSTEALDSAASSSVEEIDRTSVAEPAEGRHEHTCISAASTRSRGTRNRREPALDREAHMPTSSTPRVPDNGASIEELIKWGYDRLIDLHGTAQTKGDDAAAGD